MMCFLFSFCQRTLCEHKWIISLLNFQKGTFVELINVKVQVALLPVSQFRGPVLSFKMTGNDCSMKISKGIEARAVQLKR